MHEQWDSIVFFTKSWRFKSGRYETNSLFSKVAITQVTQVHSSNMRHRLSGEFMIDRASNDVSLKRQILDFNFFKYKLCLFFIHKGGHWCNDIIEW